MIKLLCIVTFLEKIDFVLQTDNADYGLEEKIMKKTLKRLLALALVVCAILSYMVPTANASWLEDLFGGSSSEEEETTTSVTYNFVQTGEGYDAIPDDPAATRTPPVTTHSEPKSIAVFPSLVGPDKYVSPPEMLMLEAPEAESAL